MLHVIIISKFAIKCISYISFSPVIGRHSSPAPSPVKPFEFHKLLNTYGQTQEHRTGNTNYSILARVIMNFTLPPGSTSLPFAKTIPMLLRKQYLQAQYPLLCTIWHKTLTGKILTNLTNFCNLSIFSLSKFSI